MVRRDTWRFFRWLLAAALAMAPSLGWAQPSGGDFSPGGFSLPAVGVGGLGGAQEPQLVVSAQFDLEEDSHRGRLRVTAELGGAWHLYSLTQGKGGPTPTKLKVAEHPQLAAIGEFQADRPPKVRQVEYFPAPLEEHYGRVVWTAPIELAADADPAMVVLEVTLDGLVCTEEDEGGACVPVTRNFSARLAGRYPPASATPPTRSTVEGAQAWQAAPFREANWNVAWEVRLTPASDDPAGGALLEVTARPDAGWHVYAFAAERKEEAFDSPTQIGLELPAGWTATSIEASAEPVVKKSNLAGFPDQRYHSDPITWRIRLTPTAGQAAEALPLPLRGSVAFQVCTENSCDPPQGFEFSVPTGGGDTRTGADPAIAFAASSYEAAEQLARSGPTLTAAPVREQFALESLRPQDTGVATKPLAAVVLVALVGGFLLNFMPCVLPVIGLKVLSFVEQAGHDRRRVFVLNLWYAAGIVSIFVVLATLLLVFNLGWGEQFSVAPFSITMAAVVFVMALSFLGVWEIPIPGFASSGKAAELAEREGPLGAFSKGVVTTILATPCSGPGIATAIAWSAGKPAPLVYGVFLAMGLGMAFPYLVIGAKPDLLRWMPRPGKWMETFKEVMGFVLLGTVVFFFTFIPPVAIAPTLALLIGLWAACWWIGRTPAYAETRDQAKAWLQGIAVAAAVGVFAFTWLADYTQGQFHQLIDREIARRFEALDANADITSGVAAGVSRSASRVPGAAANDDNNYKLPWQPFSLAKLQELTAANQTVLVDFTADWCITCKVLERTVLNTKAVRDEVEARGVATLLADWTDRDPELGQLLEGLGSKQVPVLAIFPAGRPNEPIVLIGGYTQSMLLRKLAEASPAADVAESVAARP